MKMNENTLATRPEMDAQIMETVLLGGDLSKLAPVQRVNYYRNVCESLGLNPLTKPFSYLLLNGKLTLYANKDCADQLRAINGVSIDDVEITETDKQYLVKVKGHNAHGRADVEIGVVAKTDMQGNLANAQMKAVTKGKRRLTLSLCGLGWLDETEIETIPAAKTVSVNPDTGEIVNAETSELVVESTAPAPQKSKAVANTIITSAEWDTFSALVDRAAKEGVAMQGYSRAEMTPETLNGVTNYLKQEIAKRSK